MLVEVGGFRVFGEAVEIGEEIRGVLAGGDGGFLGAGLGLAQEIIDERFWMDFFLDEKGRGLDFERGGGFAAPDELGIEIGIAIVRFRGHGRGVAGVGDGDW